MNKQISQLSDKCDKLATQCKDLAAGDRQKGYEIWLKEVKKIRHFVDVFNKNDPRLLGDRLEPLILAASSEGRGKKVGKVGEK